jgi:hypothetical protein
MTDILLIERLGDAFDAAIAEPQPLAAAEKRRSCSPSGSRLPGRSTRGAAKGLTPGVQAGVVVVDRCWLNRLGSSLDGR